MIDELIKEIQELKEYKEKYFKLVGEKQRLSDELYKYMMKEYEKMSLGQCVDAYENEWCICCKHYKEQCILPEDILRPIRSDKAWIPEKKSCDSFCRA